jgi:hypothetical protein
VLLEPGLAGQVPVEAVLVVLVEAGDLLDLPFLHEVIDDQPGLIRVGGQIADVPRPRRRPDAGGGRREDVGHAPLFQVLLDRLGGGRAQVSHHDEHLVALVTALGGW